VANNKALEKQLGFFAVVRVRLLQNLLGLASLAQVAFEGQTAELKLVFGESACFVAKDVIDAAQLLGQLHALDLAGGDFACFFVDFNHFCVYLHELGKHDLADLGVYDEVQR
jgi:hypothetical protein